MSIFVGAWPDTQSCITFREAAAEAATLLVSSQNGGDESRYVQEGGYSESVGHTACLGQQVGKKIGCGLIRRIQSINISSLLALQIRFSSLKHDLRTGHRLLAWAAIIRRTGVKISLYPRIRADILQFSASLNTCGNHSTNVHPRKNAEGTLSYLPELRHTKLHWHHPAFPWALIVKWRFPGERKKAQSRRITLQQALEFNSIYMAKGI